MAPIPNGIVRRLMHAKGSFGASGDTERYRLIPLGIPERYQAIPNGIVRRLMHAEETCQCKAIIAEREKRFLNGESRNKQSPKQQPKRAAVEKKTDKEKASVPIRFRAIVAHMNRSRPDSGLGFSHVRCKRLQNNFQLLLTR